MTDPRPERNAIILALDPASPGHASLDLLRRLDARQARHLLGLYVEDVELLEHAHSRLATEILRSGTARPLKLARLERQLRAQSRAIRKVVEAEAARLGLPFAFRNVRGPVVSELAIAATDADLLIVELPRGTSVVQSIWSSRLEQLCVADLPTALYLSEGWPADGTVLVILESSADLEASASAAAMLAGARAAGVVALVGEELRARESEIRAVLRAAAPGSPVRIQPLAPTELTTPALAYLLRSGRAAALVAPARLARADATLLRELLRLARCSIVLVNAAHRSDRDRPA